MKKNIKKLEEKPLDIPVMRFLSAWCISSVILCVLADGNFADLKKFGFVPLWLTAILIAGSFALISLIKKLLKKEIDKFVFPAAFAAYSILTVFLNPEWYYAFILSALWAVIVFYYHRKQLIVPKKSFSKKKSILLISVCAGLFIFFTGAAGVFKHLAYRTPNYDFGIFCQMFYNLKTKLVPLTTCERDGLLSHFAVHISPVFYLLLPVYAIFPSPLTLQISQTLIIASAVIPLALLCTSLKLPHYKTAFVSALFLFYPAAANGMNYDFHENCFLLPFLLWTFYFFEKGKYLPMGIFAFLTLTVKEDAAVYIIFFAVFVFLDRKKFAPGALLASGAAVYFIAALILLSVFGDGVMEGRYKNFIVDGGGLAEAVENALANPGFAFTQLLTDENGEPANKLLFLFQIFVPAAFLPFCVKKTSRLTLLLPLILVNLLTVYKYQFDIGFQYSFGSTAFIIYLCVLNLSEMKDDTAKKLFAVSAFACVMCFIVGPVNRAETYISAYRSDMEDIRIIDGRLKEIPDDASVVCSAFLAPHLSQRDVLYESYYHKPDKDETVDYVILDLRYRHEDEEERFADAGYSESETVSNGEKDLLLIMTKGPSETASPAE